ncbi:DUF1810 domain-containing protein [Flavobacterium sp. UMI-01]|uniref:DUF1810 domain-containing protein n=1 Tax=Flavobacterium sp. UMI-01 TaxID=1441053 RepID=UPI001C7CC2AD|nr:DUF1810 domain-containing protein [Flavobacterium sp. UMI-01]GIZ09002.1 hypothetical protein FUMI01_17290 [Flavobacterium sp. UMI-01]
MESSNNLNRFIVAQQNTFETAFTEIKKGKKKTHWMWFIFPQIRGLGFTDYNIFYAIKDINEAEKYYAHPILGKRLIIMSTALLTLDNVTAVDIFGKPDARKLQSCMTLFSQLEFPNPIFNAVLEKYYGGNKDEKTLMMLNKPI